MNLRDIFAPPKARLSDIDDDVVAATVSGGRALPVAVVCAVSAAMVLTRHAIVAAWVLADAGAIPVLAFVAMLLAYVLLPLGAVLMSLRRRGARACSALAAISAASAWVGMPEGLSSRSSVLAMACLAWLVLAIASAVSAWADVRRRRVADVAGGAITPSATRR